MWDCLCVVNHFLVEVYVLGLCESTPLLCGCMNIVLSLYACCAGGLWVAAESCSESETAANEDHIRPGTEHVTGK